MGKSQELYSKAKKIIPGGTQLLSKRPEMFLPDLWPAYYDKSKGCKVWDLDGNEYLDFSYMGLGSGILGYAFDEVDDAVIESIRKGNATTLNCPEEFYLAEKLIELHNWAEMVRFSKTGGEAMSIAVRIARASAKKDIILFCGYHGWHDWYLSANISDNKSLDGHLIPGLNPLGVVRNLLNTSFPFEYNNVEQLKNLVSKYKDNIAAIVIESIRNKEPEKEFIDELHNIKESLNIPLIVDEISSGFRIALGGAHLKLGINPDIAVFGKALGNGYPMCAVIGKSKFMDIAQETFISSTYWTERSGLTASLKTIELLKKYNVIEHINNAGKEVKKLWSKYSLKYNLPIDISGIDPLAHFSFLGEKSLVLKTLFTQSMLEKGFLASTSFYSSYSHKKEDIDLYEKALNETFEFIGDIINNNELPDKYLKTTVCQSGFKRLT
jgi:glutamate-1-semialdehyde aminotransferase